jgi:hypothetical protein
MMGDVYTNDQWNGFMHWLLDMRDGQQHDTDCPLCGDDWRTERQEDLCWCQFFKRAPARKQA